MRIGIEAQRIFREKKHGMDMVAVELIKKLQKIDKENEYFIFVKPDADPCIKETDNFSIVELEGGSYPFWEQKSLPEAVIKYRCDILHCTSNTAPLKVSCKLVVTLHDIIYMEKSYLQIIRGNGTNYQKFRNAYRRLVVPKVLKKADKIITVSNFERERISGFFNLNSDKLVAVYNGVGEHFKKVTDKDEIKRVRKRYNLPVEYFFFLGNTDPKKNTPRIIKAYSNYIKETRSSEQLVLLDFDKKELDKIIESTGSENIRNMIHLTGYVVNTDLPVIYSEANIFLYPSLRESFGIPILEAMKCGTPVITANTSSMPEVADDAAFIVDPTNVDDITKGIITLKKNTDLRDEKVNRGYANSSKYSWLNMAKKVLNLYYSIHN